MAIKAYVGIMGSGKTYEVVSQVILRALRQGRRVVSNIAGLNHEAMVELLMAEGVTTIGELIPVTHEQIREADFWLTDSGKPAFIKPGDLVAIDEVWRFWNGFGLSDEFGKRPASFMNFIRMHRQFVNPETGITCDLAIITQDIQDVNRTVKSVIEETYSFEKMTIVGQPDRYRIDVFKRGKTSGKPIRQMPGHYEDKYFPLYKSHSQSSGAVDPRELNADSRGNILKGSFYRLVLPLSIPLFIGGVWAVWSVFDVPEVEAKATTVAEQKAGQGGNGSPVKQMTIEPTQRVIGRYSNGYSDRYLVTDGNSVRMLNPPAVAHYPLTIELYLPNGELAASWFKTGEEKK